MTRKRKLSEARRKTCKDGREKEKIQTDEDKGTGFCMLMFCLNSRQVPLKLNFWKEHPTLPTGWI